MKLALIITAIVIGDFIIFSSIIVICIKKMWEPIAKAHPAQRPAADAVTKNFQSYRINLLKLGFCVHTTVDEQYLHLTPVKFLQKLGARPISIAWNCITDVKPSLIGKTMSARIGKRKIIGPAWCLELALQDEEVLQRPQDDPKG